MSVANPRTRLISFRVSEHEYARLRFLSRTQGSHSLADFVRASVCWVIDHATAGEPVPVSRAITSSFLDLRTQPQRLLEAPAPANREYLAGLLQSLQRKAETLDRDVRQLTDLLCSSETQPDGVNPAGAEDE